MQGQCFFRPWICTTHLGPWMLFLVGECWGSDGDPKWLVIKSFCGVFSGPKGSGSPKA